MTIAYNLLDNINNGNCANVIRVLVLVDYSIQPVHLPILRHLNMFESYGKYELETMALGVLLSCRGENNKEITINEKLLKAFWHRKSFYSDDINEEIRFDHSINKGRILR